MTESDLTLYELAGADPAVRFSPHCWKSRMALAHKGLDATRLPWRFAEKDSIAFSGQELVPVLVHGDKTIHDSWAIALHLETHFPERPSLFGGAAAIPTTRFINTWADTAVVAAVARVVLVDIYDCLDAKDRPYFRASREKRFGMSLEAVVADQTVRLQELHTALQPLRQMLRKQEFICGAAPGYADYCVFGMFMWVHVCRFADVLLTDDPIFAWRARLFDAFDGLARSAKRAHPSTTQDTSLHGSP